MKQKKKLLRTFNICLVYGYAQGEGAAEALAHSEFLPSGVCTVGFLALFLLLVEELPLEKVPEDTHGRILGWYVLLLLETNLEFLLKKTGANLNFKIEL
jgi:hypothetical protein